MKLTDKRFWIVWAIAELLLLASCIDSAVRSQFDQGYQGFGAVP